jgi:hypothetical protein
MNCKVENTCFFSLINTVIDFYAELVYLTVLPAAVYIASNYKLTNKNWIGNVMEGNGHDPISGNIPQVLWENYEYHEKHQSE